MVALKKTNFCSRLQQGDPLQVWRNLTLSLYFGK